MSAQDDIGSLEAACSAEVARQFRSPPAWTVAIPIDNWALSTANPAVELGDPDGALDLLDALCTERPDDLDIIEGRARVLDRLGRADESQAEFRRYLALNQGSAHRAGWIRRRANKCAVCAVSGRIHIAIVASASTVEPSKRKRRISTGRAAA